MDLSSLLATGNNMLTKLVESPIAAPVALAGLSLILKNQHPHLAGGLARQAVQEVFRPAQEKRDAQQLLLTNPDLTSTAPPPGYTGPVMNMGGLDIRRFGTRRQENVDNLYGPSGTLAQQIQASPEGYNHLMAAVPRVLPAPPQIPASSLRYTPAEQRLHELFGDLPAGPAGDTAMVKATTDFALQQTEQDREDTNMATLLEYRKQHPEMGLRLGMRKGGGLDVGLRTPTPRNAPATSRYSLIKDLFTPEEQKKLLQSGGGTGKPSRLSELQRLRDEGQISDEQYQQEIMRSDGGYDKIEYREDLKLINQQIIAAKKEILSLKGMGVPPKEIAPLEAELSSLEDQKKALQQSVEKKSGPGAPASVNTQKAVSDFITKAQQSGIR